MGLPGHLYQPGGLLLGAAVEACELMTGRQPPLGKEKGTAVGAEGHRDSIQPIAVVFCGPQLDPAGLGRGRTLLPGAGQGDNQPIRTDTYRDDGRKGPPPLGDGLIRCEQLDRLVLRCSERDTRLSRKPTAPGPTAPGAVAASQRRQQLGQRPRSQSAQQRDQRGANQEGDSQGDRHLAIYDLHLLNVFIAGIAGL